MKLVSTLGACIVNSNISMLCIEEETGTRVHDESCNIHVFWCRISNVTIFLKQSRISNA